jgi:hypothetical protein
MSYLKCQNDLASSGKVSGNIITSWRGVKRCQTTIILQTAPQQFLHRIYIMFHLIHDDTAVIMYRSLFYVIIWSSTLFEDHEGRMVVLHPPSRWLRVWHLSWLFCAPSTNFPLIIICSSLSDRRPDILFRIFILYVLPLTSIPLHSQCGYPWNYVCVIHESPPGLLTYRYVRRRLSCLYLPQLAAPRPGTRVVRLGTCFSSINHYLFICLFSKSMCIYSHSLISW